MYRAKRANQKDIYRQKYKEGGIDWMKGVAHGGTSENGCTGERPFAGAELDVAIGRDRSLSFEGHEACSQ